MDETVGRLNNCANDVAYIIGTTMSGRVETLTKWLWTLISDHHQTELPNQRLGT